MRQAAIETNISQFELRGYIENLVARIENAYWDYGLAQRRIEIVQESLKLAEQQLSETREMITIGTMAEAELAAGQAEVAVWRQDLINAGSALAVSRLTLLRLLNPPGDDCWEHDVVLVHQPELPEAHLGDVGRHVNKALKMRPEVNQANLAFYIEVERSREQIDASKATRKCRQENLRIETEKFRVGRSTSLLVAQVQRDFLAGRINEVQAVVNYLKALTDFYRLEGTLLHTRGIEAPGKKIGEND